MTRFAAPSAASPAAVPCPVCGKPAAAGRLQPFCSARCADIDLGRWLTGQYRVPGPPDEEATDDGSPSDGSA